MRSSWQLAWLGVVIGCGSVEHARPDAGAPVVDAASLDAPPAVDAIAVDAPPLDAATIDAAPMCQPTVLLMGGALVGPQGWSTITQGPGTVSYGPDYVRLETTTAMSASTSGLLLLNYPGAFEAGKPFKIQLVLLVESVSPHNQFDAGAAILGSFVPPFGVGNDRSEMIYLDSAMIGWADDSQALGVTIQNNAYHTYELAVDAAQVAHVTVDGAPALTRANFTSNGAIAVGDQSNDANVDGVMRIRSITKLCP